MSGSTAPTDTTNGIPGEQTRTLGVEHDTKQTEKQGVKLGTIQAWNGSESQELGISVPIFQRLCKHKSATVYLRRMVRFGM